MLPSMTESSPRGNLRRLARASMESLSFPGERGVSLLKRGTMRMGYMVTPTREMKSVKPRKEDIVSE